MLSERLFLKSYANGRGSKLLTPLNPLLGKPLNRNPGSRHNVLVCLMCWFALMQMRPMRYFIARSLAPQISWFLG